MGMKTRSTFLSSRSSRWPWATLPGKTGCVGGNVFKSLLVAFLTAFSGKLHLESQRAEKAVPEGHTVPELQHPGNADGVLFWGANGFCAVVGKEQFTATTHEVRYGVEFFSRGFELLPYQRGPLRRR